jgi:hypothetical protein
MDKKSFYTPDIDPYALAQALYEWFVGQNYQTQMLPAESGAVTLQARKEDAIRTFTGMSSALTVIVVSDGEHITMEMGNAKWTDKAAVGAVGVLLFPPALITAGIGAFQQSQLKSNAWRFIEQYLQNHSAFASSMSPGGAAFPPLAVQAGSSPIKPQSFNPQNGQPPRQTVAPRPPASPAGAPPPPLNLSGITTAPGVSQALICTSCKQPLRQGAKFCDNCGAPAPSSRNCRSCAKPLRPGARFCDECGTPV